MEKSVMMLLLVTIMTHQKMKFLSRRTKEKNVCQRIFDFVFCLLSFSVTEKKRLLRHEQLPFYDYFYIKFNMNHSQNDRLGIFSWKKDWITK
jgi:hypothetical protein